MLLCWLWTDATYGLCCVWYWKIKLCFRCLCHRGGYSSPNVSLTGSLAWQTELWASNILTPPCWTVSPVSWDMNALWFLSMLGMFTLREEPSCEAMTLNSVVLCHVSGRRAAGGGGGGASGCVHSQHGRRRRSWVWNQFFVLEEYTGDEPLYVGKVQTQTWFWNHTFLFWP